jgi:hypothetical protein
VNHKADFCEAKAGEYVFSFSFANLAPVFSLELTRRTNFRFTQLCSFDILETRFQTKAELLEFVEKLYDAGAMEI